MKHILALALGLFCMSRATPAQTVDGFTSLFDGKTFTGWQTAVEHTNTGVSKTAHS